MDQFESFKAAQKAGLGALCAIRGDYDSLRSQAGEVGGRPRWASASSTWPAGQAWSLVTAARLGARVNGLDLTPELLVRARENARIAGVEIEWLEGDVEKLPYERRDV